MPEQPSNLESLIARYIEGRLSESEAVSLRDRLKDDPRVWEQFVSALQLHADLSGPEVAGEFEGAEDREWLRQSIAEPKVIPLFRRRLVRLAAAAALVLAAGLLWQRPAENGGASNRPRVSRMAAAQFDHDALRTGDHPGRRSRHLNAGLVELEFPASEAKVVIEAPAGFRVVDERTLWLQSGRLSAQVREGMEGLRILTPQTDVLDLGTRFAVDVDAGERTEVHVFDGRVEAGWKNRANPSSERQWVEANEALRFDPVRAVERRSMRSASFIQPEELNGLAAGWNSGQRGLWRAWRERIVADPDLILFATLESAGLARGRDLSSIDRLGTRVVQGRWPGKQCLEFTREGDAVRLDAGGDRLWPRITLAAWVRLDRLGAPYQSLYHTDGWSTGKEGQVHWMINRRAGMRLALRGNTLAKGTTGSPDGYPDSRTPVLPERGRWVHLATVYDCEAASVRFYVNGRFDNEVRQQMAFPARFGPAQIGNWDRNDRKLSGRIDEVLILGRALNDDQIADIYRVGNPYRGGVLLATNR